MHARLSVHVVPRRARREKTKAAVPLHAPTPMAKDEEEALFLKLKVLRRKIADKRGVAAYMVFSDATLQHMARTRPTTKAHLLAISGVGKRKLYMYGDDFLAAIKDAR